MPHSPSILLFTTSAQTHIFPEIRVDAVRFLDLFLQHIPEAVTNGWIEGGDGHGKRVLEAYLGILSAGTAYGGSEGVFSQYHNVVELSLIAVVQVLRKQLRQLASPFPLL